MSVSILCNWSEITPDVKIDRKTKRAAYLKAYRSRNKDKIKAHRSSELYKARRRDSYSKATLNEVADRKTKRAAYRAANKHKIKKQRKSYEDKKKNSFKYILECRAKSLLKAYRAVIVKEKKIKRKIESAKQKEIRRIKSIIREAEYQKRYQQDWKKRNPEKNKTYVRKHKSKKKSEKIIKNFFQINAAIAALKNAGN